MKIKKIDLERLHTCKASKAKYRVHLTIGMIASVIMACVGTALHHDGLTYFAQGANLITGVWWIWE